MDNKKAIEELKQIKQNHIALNYRFRYLYDDYINAVDKAIASLEAWDEVKKEILSQSIIKTHTESYESGFSDGLERAFDIIQDIIEEHLGEE